MPEKPTWCWVANEEYPPEREVVWTSDGLTVRKGIWIYDPIPPFTPLEESAWKDEQGEFIEVTHWMPLEDSPDGPPELPPSGPPPTRGFWFGTE